eukprot:m.19231 g.19231  ORF g.19231 m.19231 type:complete len:69 (-) comp7998_c0_seq2:2422-2628(-)
MQNQMNKQLSNKQYIPSTYSYASTQNTSETCVFVSFITLSCWKSARSHVLWYCAVVKSHGAKPISIDK